jgi:hypothetical protein
MKVNIELHRSLDSALITKSDMSKKVLDILLLGDKEAIRGRRNLNPKEATKRTKISHKKLHTETGLNKGNILKVITSDDHVIDIEQKKCSIKRGGVDKQR